MRRHWKNAAHHCRVLTDSDRGLAALLVLLVLYTFFIYPLLGGDSFTGGAISIFFSLILVAGIAATSTHHAVRLAIVILAVIAFLSHWMHVFLGGQTAHVIATAAAAIFFAVQTWFLSIRVFGDGEVNIYRILGAIAVYLLLALLWANIYVLLYLTEPGAFAFAPGSQAFEPPVSEMIYFSFATLTTVGYGDIVALRPLARSLAMLEALVGQLYPAVLLARLVTQYQSSRRSH